MITKNNSNNNKSYDTKCIYHPKQDIVYFCLTCGNGTHCEPACIKCVTSNHQDHRFILIDDNDNKDLKLDISINFTNNVIPQLNEQLDILKSLLNQSNQTLIEIENNHNTNKINIKKEIQKLHNKLSLIESDLLKQLDINLDKNKEINNSITATIDDRIKTTNNIINNNNNNGADGNDDDEDDNQNKQFIEMINYEYKCRKSIVTNESIKNDYSQYEVLLDQTLIDQFYNDSISFLKLKKIKKTIDYNYEEYTIYEDGDEIQDGTQRLAIKKGHHLPLKFPESVIKLILPDEFDEPLDNLPKTIMSLILNNIKYKLEKNSTPNSFIKLVFGGGYRYQITKDIIPSSVTTSEKILNNFNIINIIFSNILKL